MKKKPDLQAVKRRDNRYAVRKRGGGFVTGDDKVKFLVDKGLIKAALPKPAEEAPAEEAPAEEAAAES